MGRKEMWKTFGTGNAAGRALKILYDHNPSSPSGKIFPRSKAHHGFQDIDTYVAEDLRDGSRGLQFRRTRDIRDICQQDGDYVRWGDPVVGLRVDDDWVKVGKRFLPTTVCGTLVLRRCHGEEGPAGRHCSTPSPRPGKEVPQWMQANTCSLPALRPSRDMLRSRSGTCFRGIMGWGGPPRSRSGLGRSSIV